MMVILYIFIASGFWAYGIAAFFEPQIIFWTIVVMDASTLEQGMFSVHLPDYFLFEKKNKMPHEIVLSVYHKK